MRKEERYVTLSSVRDIAYIRMRDSLGDGYEHIVRVGSTIVDRRFTRDQVINSHSLKVFHELVNDVSEV